MSHNEKICIWVCAFRNYNTVLLQFYAQFYSDSIQIYYCKSHIISLYFYHSIKFQLKNFLQRLKNNLHIEKKCIIIIGMKKWEGWEQSWTCWSPKRGKILWTLHKLCSAPQIPVTWSFLWEVSLSPLSFFSWREATNNVKNQSVNSANSL